MGNEFELWGACGIDEQCVDRHQDVPDPIAPRAPRMVGIRVALRTGRIKNTGGWSMGDLAEQAEIPIRTETRARIVQECRDAKPRGDEGP